MLPLRVVVRRECVALVPGSVSLREATCAVAPAQESPPAYRGESWLPRPKKEKRGRNPLNWPPLNRFSALSALEQSVAQSTWGIWFGSHTGTNSHTAVPPAELHAQKKLVLYIPDLLMADVILP